MAATLYVGCDLYSENGEKIGTVTDVIMNPTDLEPEWLTVKPGMFKREHLVPVMAVEKRDEMLVTPVDADLVRHGPPAGRHVRPTSTERAKIIAHYGLPVDE